MSQARIEIDDTAKDHFLLGEMEENIGLPAPGATLEFKIPLVISEPQEYSDPERIRCFVSLKLLVDPAVSTQQDALLRAKSIAAHINSLIEGVQSIPDMTFHQKAQLCDEIRAMLQKPLL